MTILFYFDNRGREVRKTFSTVEDALLAYRSARGGSPGANWGRYSIDNGETWHRI